MVGSGPPTSRAWSLFGACSAVSEARCLDGAAPVVSSHYAIELIVDDVGCVTDIDTLDDLARAEMLAQRAH